MASSPRETELACPTCNIFEQAVQPEASGGCVRCNGRRADHTHQCELLSNSSGGRFAVGSLLATVCQGRLRCREPLLSPVHLLQTFRGLLSVGIRTPHLALFQRRLRQQSVRVLVPPSNLLLQLLVFPAETRHLQAQMPLLFSQRTD